MAATNLAIASANSQTKLLPREVFSKQFAMTPVRSMDELVTSPSIAMHMVDKENLTLCIATAIGKYLNFIGLSDTMSEEATYETAQMIIELDPHVPVGAIKTFFYECKRGTYGYHYNKMDGSKLLMWYRKFVQEYYNAIDEAEYKKHLEAKSDFAKPVVDDEEDAEESKNAIVNLVFKLTHHGMTKEDYERKQRIEDIRHEVIKQHMHLYNTMPVKEVDALIEKAIEDRLVKENIITF